MKTKFHAVFNLLLIFTFGCAASGDELSQGLKDPDPSVRLNAWNSIANSGEEVLKKIDQLVPLLPFGLRDPDHAVRSEVAKIAAVIALAGHQQKKHHLPNNAEMVSSLFDLLDEKDVEIRKNAETALALGVEPSQALEDELLSRYSHETDPDRQAELIGVLLMTSGKKWPHYRQREPTDAVLGVIVKALDDPNKAVRRACVEAIENLKAPPAEALPKLIEQLNVSDPYTCQSVASAIGRYGSAASQYLPKLEQSRADVENLEGTEGKVLRDNLDRTIRIISDASQKEKSQPGSAK